MTKLLIGIYDLVAVEQDYKDKQTAQNGILKKWKRYMYSDQ